MKLSDITDIKTIQDRQGIKQWMSANTINDLVRYNINNDLSVSVSTSWTILGNRTNSPVLPVKIASVNGTFEFTGTPPSCRLTSLQNFPASITGRTGLLVRFPNIVHDVETETDKSLFIL